MIFIVHSRFSKDRIGANLGAPEYSYYFVMKRYWPILERMGEVKLVTNPAVEVDPIYRTARERDERCAYLSFHAPHDTVLGLECPTVAIFPWEFDTVPDEVFDDDIRSDWTHVFSRITGVVTHSSFTRDVLRARLDSDYPVASIPAPVWDTFMELTNATPVEERRETALLLDCAMLDSRAIDLGEVERCLHPSLSSDPSELGNAATAERSVLAATRHCLTAWYRDAVSGILTDLLSSGKQEGPGAAAAERRRCVEYSESVSFAISDRNPKVQALRPVLNRFLGARSDRVELSGVIYTAVLNPNDGRKNWHDIVCAFCKAFQAIDDATLVLKLVHHDSENMLLDLIHRLYQLTPFKCRVLVIDGFLNQEGFGNLIRATTFAVNASHGEGQCLPLMEFMSAGIPAIAPAHTGMQDYVNRETAFVVQCSREPHFFPHDPRAAYRTRRFRIDWQSLTDALKNSYRLIKENPVGYAEMAQKSSVQMRAHCSEQVVQESLERYFAAPAIRRSLERPRPPRAADDPIVIEAQRWERVRRQARQEGWFLNGSRQLCKDFRIESNDTILDMDSTLAAPCLYCATLGVKLLLHGTDRQLLSNRVKQLAQENTHYFRALLSDAEDLIPFPDDCATKILLLESLQYKADPLAYLKEAVRVGLPRARYLVSAPLDNGGRQSVSEECHCWNPGDLKHLVTEAGLQVEQQLTLGSFWQDLKALESREDPEAAARWQGASQLIIATKQAQTRPAAETLHPARP